MSCHRPKKKNHSPIESSLWEESRLCSTDKSEKQPPYLKRDPSVAMGVNNTTHTTANITCRIIYKQICFFWFFVHQHFTALGGEWGTQLTGSVEPQRAPLELVELGCAELPTRLPGLSSRSNPALQLFPRPLCQDWHDGTLFQNPAKLARVLFC